MKKRHNIRLNEASNLNIEISMKNGTIRVVTDFRKLNLLLKGHPFPIPKIGDMIRSMGGFTFVSELELNIGYSHQTKC
jgi:hypothetical protein